MIIQSSDLYASQQIANLYRKQTSNEEEATEVLNTESSLSEYNINYENEQKNVSEISAEMQNDPKGMNNRMNMTEAEGTDTIGTIISSDSSELTTDEMTSLLSEIQSNLQTDDTSSVSTLLSEVSLDSLEEDEISDLYADVKTELESGSIPMGPPPMGPPPTDSVSDEEDLEAEELTDWLSELSDKIKEGTYTQDEITSLIDDYLTSI